ncbi:hypothetical protein BaRGS_00009339 [Batillaria attramentaria]|uniref:Uncharacterized protein n=1 Tax=Batillaria attramentaria TaxID=370345 RepID=A0ABD0LIM9_9CAEN
MNKTGSTLQTVHCPQGITEKDIVTYFTKVHHGASEREARAAVSLLRSHDNATWRQATLSIRTECLGEVCFVSGRGTNRFSVRLEGAEDTPRAVYENLFLGFFRLMVALAALGQGSMVAIMLTGRTAANADTVAGVLWNVLLSV